MTQVSALTNGALTDIYGDVPDNGDLSPSKSSPPASPLTSPQASPQASPQTSPQASPKEESPKKRQKELPPHWERVLSEEHKRYYYWHRETGKTSWKFPLEEAKEHSKMVRSHEYMNIAIKTPPNKPRMRIVAADSLNSTDGDSTKEQNDNLATSTPPQRSRSSYVNIELVKTASSLPPEPKTPLSPVSTDLSIWSSQSDEGVSPLSPTPPLPPRNYSESDLIPDTPATQPDHPKSSIEAKNGSESPLLKITPVKHTITTQGHEYAVIDKHTKEEDIPITRIISPPPPVPLKARQRLAQDAEEAGYTDIAEKTINNRIYAELEIPSDNHPDFSNQNPKSPVAYAVVDLANQTTSSIDGRQEITKRSSLGRPRPYEVPTYSMENLADGYETVPEKPEEDDEGYMKVNRDTLLSYQRSSSLGQMSMRKISSNRDVGESPLTRRESPLTGRESPSGDSVFESDQPYCIPSNSKKLSSVTLPRTAPHVPGYSRLEDLSKEAILLRSGITLKRYRQLDSVSSLRSQPGEGSGESSGGSDHDDGLEPVNKAIKSLETSLGVSADSLTSPPLQLVRAPAGPPSWTKVQRRPHAYEPVSDSTNSNLTESSNQAKPKQLITSSTIEMDWDETELKSGLTKVSNLSQQRAASQPNLLKDSDVVFPHLKRPARVSEEAFKLRQTRLLNHKYEKMEKGEESVTFPQHTESVGDVITSTGTPKQCWTEGGEGELPKGWQTMRDESKRVYYWHVPSGKTQYERPTDDEIKRLSLSVDDSQMQEKMSPAAGVVEGRKRPSPAFRALFVGSWNVQESDLVQGECVKVVHSCICKINDNPPSSPSNKKETKLFLQVHGATLRWLDPETSSPTLIQPINKIRVWGIGIDNERDFGYVARDPNSKQHMCHVFRCERPARAVARALLEAHQRDRQERKAKKAMKKGEKKEPNKGVSVSSDSSKELSPPASVRGVSHSQSPDQEDEYERITCTYIGSCDVFQKQGIDAVNDAVGRLCMENNSRYIEVHVDVATSHIRISAVRNDTVIAEHRVRFLTFLGIAREERYCGYILDNGTQGNVKQLRFHGFRKEPNTDRLCLAIHKACQARYQRVLESNPDAKIEGVSPPSEAPPPPVPKESPPLKPRSSPTLFERLGSLRRTKKPLVEDESKLQSFVVQYLGCQGVSKSEGLDAVRIPLQQMAQPTNPSYAAHPFLVDFDVTPEGIFLTDPQKKVFNKKSFPVKNITYIVRIREYFAFISRDNGKLNCHVFLQNEVDSGTIVNTVEKMLAPTNRAKSPSK